MKGIIEKVKKELKVLYTFSKLWYNEEVSFNFKKGEVALTILIVVVTAILVC